MLISSSLCFLFRNLSISILECGNSKSADPFGRHIYLVITTGYNLHTINYVQKLAMYLVDIPNMTPMAFLYNDGDFQHETLNANIFVALREFVVGG